MKIDYSQMVTANTIAAESLSLAQTEAKGNILAAIEAVTDAMTGQVPLAEKLCWAAKEAAARSVLAKNASDADMALISGEAAMTGEASDALVARIVQSADAYRGMMATLTGFRRAAEAAISEARDATDVARASEDALKQLAGIAAAAAD